MNQTEIQHSPGPWQMGTGDRNRNWVYDFDHNLVAIICSGTQADGDIDAVLIAAAPDLLSALVTIEEALTYFRKTGDWSHLHAWIEGKRAETVIDKARGAA